MRIFRVLAVFLSLDVAHDLRAPGFAAYDAIQGPQAGVASRRPSEPYHLKSAGAAGDGRTDDTAAINAWLSSCAAGIACYIDAGKYKLSASVTIDVPLAGMSIDGAGADRSLLHFADTPGAHLIIRAANGAAAFYGKFSGFGVLADHAGPALEIGRGSLTDALNSFTFSEIQTHNGSTASMAAGIAINYVLFSTFNNVVANNNGHGDALRCNQCVGDTFNSNAYGTADKAVRLTKGTNNANTFNSTDLENVCVGIESDVATNVSNTFNSPAIGAINRDCPSTGFINSTAGSGTLVNNPSLGSFTAQAAFALANSGVSWISSRYPVSTPPFPASGVNVTNKSGRSVVVTIVGGTVRVVTANGMSYPNNAGATGVQTFILRSGSSISAEYSGSPEWTWASVI